MREISADDVIAHLDLAPHPEGGYFRESFRDAPEHEKGRALSTAIYYLLRDEDISRWHRVDAAEVWHWYAGGALEISTTDADNRISQSILGVEFIRGQVPQIVVPAFVWQSARPLGGWVLVGCTVAPGFEFSGFEMADDDFLPVE